MHYFIYIVFKNMQNCIYLGYNIIKGMINTNVQTVVIWGE